LSVALIAISTASTTARTVVASNVFSSSIMELGVCGLAAAAMIHSAATVLDHLPHCSFYHSTGGSVFMGMNDRMKLMPYESLLGLTLAVISTLIFGVFKLFI